jgi:hypothetical protein
MLQNASQATVINSVSNIEADNYSSKFLKEKASGLKPNSQSKLPIIDSPKCACQGLAQELIDLNNKYPQENYNFEEEGSSSLGQDKLGDEHLNNFLSGDPIEAEANKLLFDYEKGKFTKFDHVKNPFLLIRINEKLAKKVYDSQNLNRGTYDEFLEKINKSAYSKDNFKMVHDLLSQVVSKSLDVSGTTISNYLPDNVSQIDFNKLESAMKDKLVEGYKILLRHMGLFWKELQLASQEDRGVNTDLSREDLERLEGSYSSQMKRLEESLIVTTGKLIEATDTNNHLQVIINNTETENSKNKGLVDEYTMKIEALQEENEDLKRDKKKRLQEFEYLSKENRKFLQIFRFSYQKLYEIQDILIYAIQVTKPNEPLILEKMYQDPNQSYVKSFKEFFIQMVGLVNQINPLDKGIDIPDFEEFDNNLSGELSLRITQIPENLRNTTELVELAKEGKSEAKYDELALPTINLMPKKQNSNPNEISGEINMEKPRSRPSQLSPMEEELKKLLIEKNSSIGRNNARNSKLVSIEEANLKKSKQNEEPPKKHRTSNISKTKGQRRESNVRENESDSKKITRSSGQNNKKVSQLGLKKTKMLASDQIGSLSQNDNYLDPNSSRSQMDEDKGEAVSLKSRSRTKNNIKKFSLNPSTMRKVISSKLTKMQNKLKFIGSDGVKLQDIFVDHEDMQMSSNPNRMKDLFSSIPPKHHKVSSKHIGVQATEIRFSDPENSIAHHSESPNPELQDQKSPPIEDSYKQASKKEFDKLDANSRQKSTFSLPKRLNKKLGTVISNNEHGESMQNEETTNPLKLKNSIHSKTSVGFRQKTFAEFEKMAQLNSKFNNENGSKLDNSLSIQQIDNQKTSLMNLDVGNGQKSKVYFKKEYHTSPNVNEIMQAVKYFSKALTTDLYHKLKEYLKQNGMMDEETEQKEKNGSLSHLSESESIDNRPKIKIQGILRSPPRKYPVDGFSVNIQNGIVNVSKASNFNEVIPSFHDGGNPKGKNEDRRKSDMNLTHDVLRDRTQISIRPGIKLKKRHKEFSLNVKKVEECFVSRKLRHQGQSNESNIIINKYQSSKKTEPTSHLVARLSIPNSKEDLYAEPMKNRGTFADPDLKKIHNLIYFGSKSIENQHFMHDVINKERVSSIYRLNETQNRKINSIHISSVEIRTKLKEKISSICLKVLQSDILRDCNPGSVIVQKVTKILEKISAQFVDAHTTCGLDCPHFSTFDKYLERYVRRYVSMNAMSLPVITIDKPDIPKLHGFLGHLAKY